MKITIIGGGNMGQAIARALKENLEVKSAEVMVSDVNPNKLENLKDLEVKLTDKNPEAVDGANVVILAVKPQHLNDLLDEIKPHISENQIIMSIAAGVKMGKIKDKLEHKKIVRVMPNLPAQIGKAASVWMAEPAVSGNGKQVVRDLLKCFGKEYEVTLEEQIDVATALSGSGPAYVFRFIECLANGAIFLGMPEELAVDLAMQTVYGSVKYAQNSKLTSQEELQVLQHKVASKGGTTEAALDYLDEVDFEKDLTYAVKKAYKKAKELAKDQD